MVDQSGRAASASRNAPAWARKRAAFSTAGFGTSYSSACSSAINPPTYAGLFCPGIRRATHHASSACATAFGSKLARSHR
jgi:hypothetical protein